ncbi:MAG: response regulator, partial [Elusimicrobiota bacterium]
MARIMLVEDNVIYRELLKELCELDGHEVLETSRAEDALAMLKNYHEVDVYHKRQTIDLFITDFNMDLMNGYEFIQEVRSLEGMREVPIIMISSTDKDITELLQLSGVSFLRKPSSNIAVMESVRRLLAEKGVPTMEEKQAAAQAPSRPMVAVHAATKLPTVGSLPPARAALPPARAALPPAPPSALPPAPPATLPLARAALPPA